MKYSFLFAGISLAGLSAAYMDDEYHYAIRDVDYDSYLRARDADLAVLLPRSSAAKGAGGIPPKPAGGSGLGHSRLPIPPQQGSGRMSIPPPPPGVKIAKTAPLGAPKERNSWPMPSIHDFAKNSAMVPSKTGKTSFPGGTGKAEFSAAGKAASGGGFMSKFGMGRKSKVSSMVKPTKEEHGNYLSRPAMRPGASTSAEPSEDHSSRRGMGFLGGLEGRPDDSNY